MNTLRPHLILLLFFTCIISAHSQTNTQTIRGTIKDKVSGGLLPGATVLLVDDSSSTKAVNSDADGAFRFEEVAVGRHEIKVTFIGYKPLDLPNVLVRSGRETVLSLEMEESAVSIKTFEITGERKDGTVNQMASGSTRLFSMDEAERYAGSRADAGRMASNYAGVQGADDSRNDIVIRGNSPMGLLWRIEDVDVPNPNHFSTPGTSGGPVSILNAKTLATSDFLTGAFPAEYGNSNAGVFDLKMRNGNNEKHEFTAQFGFLGTELLAEGPISKKNHSSYLATYRYSTLKLFEAMHIKIGTDAVPAYQDASFKLSFPTKKAGTFSFFGIGGMSGVDILVSTYTEPKQEIYGDQDRDQYFNTSMAAVGVSNTYQINSSSYTKLTIAQSISHVDAYDNLVYRNPATFHLDSMIKKLGYMFNEGRTSLNFSYNKKVSNKFNYKAGIRADRFQYNLLDSNFNESSNIYRWDKRADFQGDAYLGQAFVEGLYKANDKVSFNAGVHSQYFLMNKSSSIEPRAGVKWIFHPKQALSLSFGMHSQMQPSYIYFLRKPSPTTGDTVQLNRNLDFTKSNHLVLTYDYSVNSMFRVKIETYYQWIYNAPVTYYASAFSLLNQGSAYNRFFPDSLINIGTGNNYGIELTLEKFYGKNWFLLATGALYSSTYYGSDGVERNTNFNGRFATNLVAGKEFFLSKSHNTTLELGTKVTWAGGQRYTPPDTLGSLVAKELIEIDSLRNSLQFHDYFRIDFKVGVRINGKHVAHEIGLDLVNAFGIKNLLDIIYAPDPKNPLASPLRAENELGFLPLFYYKADF